MEIVTKTIGSLAKRIKTGSTPKTADALNFENANYNWFTPGDFSTSNLTLENASRKISEYAVDNSATIYEPLTVLITCIGDIGNSGIIEKEASANQQITGVLVNDRIINPFLFNYLIRNNKKVLQNKSNHAVVPILNNKNLKEIELSFPKDLETQTKIVAILDKAKALLDKREQTIIKYDELLRATFLDMFGDPVLNTKKWEVKSFKKVAKNENSKRVPIKASDRDERDGPYPYYGATGVIDFFDAYKFDGDYLLIAEDGKNLLYNRKNNAFLASGKFWVNNHAHVLSDNGICTIYYLLFFLNLIDLKPFITGIDQIKLNKGNLEKIPVPVPPKDLQRKFNSIYLKYEILKQKIVNSKVSIEQLSGGLTQLAFKGELDLNTAVDLEVLLENDYQFFKANSDAKSIRLLLERLDKNELNKKKFSEQEVYDKAKEFAFELLKEGKIKQVFDKKTKRVKLTV